MRYRVLLGVCATLFGALSLRLAWAGPPVAGSHSARGAAPAAPAVYGQIVAGDQPAAAQTVVLRRYLDAQQDVAVLTATTTITGYYVFPNPPTPPAGWTYYVRYGPNTTQPAYVAAWYGPDVAGYQAGETRSGGLLNIANVELVEPPDNAYVGFPATFRWRARGVESDDYTWLLRDEEHGGGWATARLGAVEAVTFDTPDDFEGLTLGRTYRWQVRVDDTAEPGSYGYSFARPRVFVVAQKSTLYLPYVISAR